MKKIISDKKREFRENFHLTRPPRMEGKVKNAKMNPIKKIKKSVHYHPFPLIEPFYVAGEEGYEYPEDET